MPTKSDLISSARSFIGAPYKASGAQACGMNCIGAFVLWLRKAGLTELADEAEPYVNYARPLSAGDMLRRLQASKHLKLVRPKRLIVGNMILIRFGGDPQHVAIITESSPHTTVIHASRVIEKVVEQYIPSDWYVQAEFAFLGLEES